MAMTIGQIAWAEDFDRFARQWLVARTARNTAGRQSLLHSASRACRLSGSNEYDRWIDQRTEPLVRLPLRRTVLTALPAKSQGSVGQGQPATHRIVLHLGDPNGNVASLELLVARENGAWREVRPCPEPEQAGHLGAMVNERAKSKARAVELAARIPASLRESLLRLLADGSKVEAIREYAKETGESLSLSKDVVEALIEQLSRQSR